jgi:PAS domain S-box-containing protein
MVNVDGVGLLVFAVPEGRLVDANDHFLRMFGYTREELAAAPLTWRDMTPPEYVAESERQMERLAARGRIGPYEKEYLRKDGTRSWMVFAGAALGDGTIVEYCIDVSDRKQAEAALRASEERLREARDRLEERVAERTAVLERANAILREAMSARTELLRRLSSAQEDERRRLSRELHDGLGQELTALILSLKALEQAVPEGVPGRNRLMEVERVVNQISREAHDVAVELRPTALDDLGLVPALSAYVARWSERTEVAATFQPLGLGAGRLPAELETTVYRVVQEALNNVAKHAGARRVDVMVARQEDELVVVIEDDGTGFDPERAGAGSGGRSLGLLGMRERLGLVGGAMEIESGEGDGTVVQARIPLPRASGEGPHGR